MPKPPKTIEEIDQRKAGLHDDHDPRDPVHKQNDNPKGEQGSEVDSQGLPADDSKFG